MAEMGYKFHDGGTHFESDSNWGGGYDDMMV